MTMVGVSSELERQLVERMRVYRLRRLHDLLGRRLEEIAYSKATQPLSRRAFLRFVEETRRGA